WASLTIDFPRSDLLRKALERQESSEAVRAALARAESERLALAALQTSDHHRAVLARATLSRGFALDWIADAERLREACLVKRTQAAVLASQLPPPPTEAFWEARAETVHRLCGFLRARNPADEDPPWLIVAAFMWYLASWNVDPDTPGTVKTLEADY